MVMKDTGRGLTIEDPPLQPAKLRHRLSGPFEESQWPWIAIFLRDRLRITVESCDNDTNA